MTDTSKRAIRSVLSMEWQTYKALFDQVARTREPVQIECKSMTELLSLRGLLYTYLKTCRVDRATAISLGINVDEQNGVALQIVREKMVLQLQHQREMPANVAARAAVARLNAFSTHAQPFASPSATTDSKPMPLSELPRAPDIGPAAEDVDALKALGARLLKGDES